MWKISTFTVGQLCCEAALHFCKQKYCYWKLILSFLAVINGWLPRQSVGHLDAQQLLSFFPKHNLSYEIYVIFLFQGQSTYSRQIKQVEDDIQQLLKKINELTGMLLS